MKPLAIAAAIVVALAGVADARERLIRPLDGRNGLPTASVYAVAQDRAGFMWIGTIGGLLRYDGHELRRVAPDTIHEFVDLIRADRDGSVIVHSPHAVWRITGLEAAPLAGPDGAPLGHVRDVLVATDGSLWTIVGDVVWRRRPDGTWTPLAGLTEPTHVREGPGGTIYVGSPAAVWRLDGGGPHLVTYAKDLVDGADRYLLKTSTVSLLVPQLAAIVASPTRARLALARGVAPRTLMRRRAGARPRRVTIRREQ